MVTVIDNPAILALYENRVLAPAASARPQSENATVTDAVEQVQPYPPKLVLKDGCYRVEAAGGAK